MQSRRTYVKYWALSCVVACAVCGCTREIRDGDTTIFSFALWVPGLVLVGGVMGFLAGLLLRKTSSRWSWGLMIMGPLACVVIAPGLCLDKVTVSKDGFTLQTGFWFAPTAHDVQFADLLEMEWIAEERTSGRGKRISYFLVCHRKSGTSEKVPVGDLMKQGAAAKILDLAATRGVRIVKSS